MKDNQNVIRILKALSDRNRLKIVKILSDTKPKCVYAIVRELSISQPAVSKHLKILTECNLLTQEKKGMHVHYKINKKILSECGDYILGISK